MNKIIETVTAALIILVGISIIALIMSYPVMWLWNWNMPVISGSPKITVKQALGLSLLCNILFTSSK